jgi:hypothetical protein
MPLQSEAEEPGTLWGKALPLTDGPKEPPIYKPNQRRAGFGFPVIIYYAYYMDVAAIIKPAAEIFGLSIEDTISALEERREKLARETTGRATAKPRPVAANLKAAARELAATKRGPRVKPDPRLPAKAPEIYKKRVRREELGGRKENIIQFVERVYAPWRKILARADLRRLDETADAAVERWISRKRPLPEGLLLTEYELNTDKRQLEANQPPRKPKQQFARMLREGVRAAG